MLNICLFDKSYEYMNIDELCDLKIMDNLYDFRITNKIV